MKVHKDVQKKKIKTNPPNTKEQKKIRPLHFPHEF